MNELLKIQVKWLGGALLSFICCVIILRLMNVELSGNVSAGVAFTVTGISLVYATSECYRRFQKNSENDVPN